MAAEKIERSGVGFAVSRQNGPTAIEVRLHHDTISAFKGAKIDLELLNGVTPEQARKILDVLSENVVSLRVTIADSDGTASKTQTASR